MHRSKQLKLFGHFVGAGEQKMRDYDLAELARVRGVNFPKTILRMSDRDHPKVCSFALMQPEHAVHGVQFGWLDELGMRNGNCEQMSFE